MLWVLITLCGVATSWFLSGPSHTSASLGDRLPCWFSEEQLRALGQTCAREAVTGSSESIALEKEILKLVRESRDIQAWDIWAERAKGFLVGAALGFILDLIQLGRVWWRGWVAQTLIRLDIVKLPAKPNPVVQRYPRPLSLG